MISNPALWQLHMSEGRAEAIGTWAKANGLTPRDVSVDHDIVIDGPDDTRVIRYHAYLRNERGSKYSVDGRDLAVEERVVPLVVEPPEDWPKYAVPDSV